MIVVPLILVLAGWRLGALQGLCMFGAAFTLAEVAKKLIGEHRPRRPGGFSPVRRVPSWRSGGTR
jgi:hypothetical protein